MSLHCPKSKILLVILICYLCICPNFLKAAWTEPLADPPDQNALPPIYRDANVQYGPINIKDQGDGTLGVVAGAGKLQAEKICICGGDECDPATECKTSWDSMGSWVENAGNIYYNLGNVGIGTATPSEKLDISTAGRSILALQGDQNANWVGTVMREVGGSETWFVGANGNKLLFRRNASTNDMVIDTSGNVGIGTTIPLGKLNINGGDLVYTNGTNYGTWRYGARLSGLAGLKGRQINSNTDFLEGASTYGIYDNGGSGSISFSLMDDTAAPNTSGRVLQISHIDLGVPSPGWGGFQKAFSKCAGISSGQCYREGNRIVYRIWAKIPAGYSINFASNSYGGGGNYRWISSQSGTGNWEEYIAVQTIGSGGVFSSTGFWYISGGTRPFTWSVATVDIIDVDQPADVDRASELNVGYKKDVALGTGSLLTTNSTYLAADGGNVGIGTIAPSAKLEVNGTIKATSFDGAIINSTLYGDPRIGKELIGYNYDMLIGADKKYTITKNGISGSNNSLFDGRPETGLPIDSVPATVEVDLKNMTHYIYAFAISSTWGTTYDFSSSFKIEKYYDSNSGNGWDSNCDNSEGDLGWAIVADVNGFSGDEYITRSGLGNGICKIKITLNDEVGSNPAFSSAISEIAMYRYYYGDDGIYLTKTGLDPNYYSSLNFWGGNLNFVQTNNARTYIDSNKGIQLRLDKDNNDANADLAVNDGNNNTIFNIQENGNVGIGATVLGQKLTVVGTSKFQGHIAVDGTGAYNPDPMYDITTPGIYAAKGEFSNLCLGGGDGANCLNSWVSIGAQSGWTDDGVILRLTEISDKVGIGINIPTEQLEITKNFRLPATTGAATGVIMAGNNRFIHNYGVDNTFVGLNAGNFTMTGIGNTANGRVALNSNTTGNYNTANGLTSLYFNTTGSYNTANGYNSLYTNTIGSYNTAYGNDSLHLNDTGINNTALGSSAGYSNIAGSGNVFLGYNAGYNETTSNKLYIDNSNTATPLIYGDFSTDTLTVNGNVGIGITDPTSKLSISGGIAIDGTPQRGNWNSRVPLNNVNTVVDATGNVGFYSSMTIGRDGLPVISYSDVTNKNVKVLKCGNTACSSGNEIHTISSGEIGYGTSIVIGSDGFPVIFYYFTVSQSCYMAKCSNVSCSAFTIQAVELYDSKGGYSSMAIGIDGFPIVSYYDFTNKDLKFAKCNDMTCSSGDINIIDATNDVGQYSSIVIGVDGFPVISYYNNTSFDLKVLKCGNVACTSGNTITTVDSSGAVGQHTSITIGVDGFPVISYYKYTTGNLRVAKCGNAACNSGNTITEVESGGDVDIQTSIAIGADGLPIISYVDASKSDLKVVKCGNSVCNSGNTITTVDAIGAVGNYSSIAIGTDGLPVISYYDATNGDLKVAKCGNERCIPYWTRR